MKTHHGAELSHFSRPPAIVIGVAWANGLGLIRSLGQAGVPVLALDPTPDAIGFYSRYTTAGLACPDPGEEEAAFLEFMDQLGARLPHSGVLFLTRDQDVSTVGRNRSRLEEHFHVPFAPWDVIRRIVDKRGQYRVAREIDVPLPVTLFPSHDEALERAAQQVPYPALVKPAYHARFSQRFGVKGFVASSPDEAMEHVRLGAEHGYEMMIQEIIPGGSDHLYTYGSYLNSRGELLGEFTGRKLRQRPRRFGTCRAGESCPAPRVAELGLRMLRALDFWGISQVEFKLDPRDRQFKLIEVNARNYQWQHLATACGVNLAHIAYRDVLGQRVTPVRTQQHDRRWILLASDLTLTPLEILRGQYALSTWLDSMRRVAATGILSWDDPQPGRRYLSQQVARRFRRRGTPPS